jgi:DNA-binding transcriptional regulator LsrR (DeoR family)
MPTQRLWMRQVREVLRLKHVAGHSERRIAAAVGISRYTVAEYLRRAAMLGIHLAGAGLSPWRRG